MKMDEALVNRALLNVGQFALVEADRIAQNTTFVICKQFYIETFLEALSEVDWTGGRKRSQLIRSGRPVKHNNQYSRAYDLPFDCARPIELQNNEPFILEDRIIYTGVANAELLYVSNGKILRSIVAVIGVRPGNIPDMEYFTGGQPGADPNVTLRSGGPQDFMFFGKAGAPQPPEWPTLPATDNQADWIQFYADNPNLPPVPLPDDPEPEPDDDFPDYQALTYEPKFYQYVEMMLAAKLAVKLSNDMNLSNSLLQKAYMLKSEAYDTSKSQKASKANGSAWWGEELGFASQNNIDSRGNLIRPSDPWGNDIGQVR